MVKKKNVSNSLETKRVNYSGIRGDEIQWIPIVSMKIGYLEAWQTFKADIKESLYILLSDALRRMLG